MMSDIVSACRNIDPLRCLVWLGLAPFLVPAATAVLLFSGFGIFVVAITRWNEQHRAAIQRT